MWIFQLDLSTGEFRATEIDLSEVSAALETLNAREAVVAAGAALKLPCIKTDVEPWVFGADYAGRSLCDHFHLLALDGCGLEGRPLAVGAAAAILIVRGKPSGRPWAENGSVDASTAKRDDTDETFSGLAAGVYTCAVDISP